MRDWHTPDDANDYNNTLLAADVASAFIGGTSQDVGSGLVMTGTVAAAAGTAVAATGVGAPVGAPVAGVEIAAAKAGAAIGATGVLMQLNSANNASKGYNYGANSSSSNGKSTGGGKNSPHANLKARQSASENYNTAKTELDNMRKMPNKTSEIKKQERLVNQLQKKKDFTGEEHAKNAKGNR